MNLIPNNPNKKIESICIEKYININKINIKIINYKENLNINKEIIKVYRDKPDLIIINFSNNSPDIIKNIPKYPIFLNNIFYITPICIEQINGFDNKSNNKDYLINNFIQRIKFILGGIITNEKLKVKDILNINLSSGIKDYMKNNFEKKWFVNKIPKWMSKNFEINNAGWFADYNKLAIDYIYENYKIKNVAELGSYYGLSTKYLASKKKGNLYSFDEYKNILLTDFVITNLTPFDKNYFLKYIKFESFHKNLENYENIYSVKYDCYNACKLLYENNIDIDLFYIDFCKIDNKIIKVVDEIFHFYPNSIIIGDDAVYLNESLKYFKNKYDYVNLETCYICSKKLINKDNLLKNFKIMKKNNSTNDLEELKKLDEKYKINYIIKLIKNNSNIKKIIDDIEKLKIDPNTKSNNILQNGNIFIYIASNFYENKNYYYELYNKLNEIYVDKKITNNFNLSSDDYFNYKLDYFM
jgi:hypothetical protein